MNNFFKYQSLGNDFIITEDCNFTEEEIRNFCDRHYGIGADGILIFKRSDVVIYNSDGSEGNLCLNGIRCVALHLNKFYNFPKKFTLTMAGKRIEHIFDGNEITQIMDFGVVEGTCEVAVGGRTYIGNVVNVGNPHFIIFEDVDKEWLRSNGNKIEHHKNFPFGTNVEFVWGGSDGCYEVLVYERGCGMTLSCSSGAAAIMTLLSDRLKKISLRMPGGTILCRQKEERKVELQAEARMVFSGKIISV